MEPAEYERMFQLEDHHWWFRSRLALVRRVLEWYAPRIEGRAPRLLDLGCGTGLFLEHEADRRAVVGLDFAPEALGFCRRRGLKRLVCADSQYLPFTPESYDIVTALDHLEHVEGDGMVVDEIHRVLRPGGVFMATVPAHPYLWSSHDVALHHKRRYRKNGFDGLFSPDRWERLRLTYAFMSIYPIAAAVRLGRRLLPQGSEPAADVSLNPGFLNRALLGWHCAEAACAERFNLPFGLSILTVRLKRGSP